MVATRAATNGQAEIKRVPLFRVSTQVCGLLQPAPVGAIYEHSGRALICRMYFACTRQATLRALTLM